CLPPPPSAPPPSCLWKCLHGALSLKRFHHHLDTTFTTFITSTSVITGVVVLVRCVRDQMTFFPIHYKTFDQENGNSGHLIASRHCLTSTAPRSKSSYSSLSSLSRSLVQSSTRPVAHSCHFSLFETSPSLSLSLSLS